MPPPLPSQIRLATASPATRPTRAETIEQLSVIAKKAADENADILLLPEAYIGGYPRGADFGASIGGRTQEGRDQYLQYFAQSVDLGDTVNGGAGEGDAWVRREIGGCRRRRSTQRQSLDGEEEAVRGREGGEGGEGDEDVVVDGDGTRETLENIAAQTGVFLVTGLIERVGGSLYCAVVYVCPRLGMLGKRRKVMPTGAERLVWAQGSPSTLKAVTTVIRGTRINLAAAVCWENYMPLVRQSLYAQNVNLYLAPTADGRDAWASLMRTVGIEGRCFVVSSNMCVKKGGGGGYDGDGTSGGSSGGGGGVEGKRRKSMHQIVKDEYGNEIVLPVPGPAATTETEALDETTPTAVVPFPPTEKSRLASSAVAEGGSTKPSPEEFASRGGSCIVSPFGDVLAGPQWEDDEGIIYADVDFKECIRGRLDLDVAGSYSRNDSFKFSVEGLDLRPLSYYY